MKKITFLLRSGILTVGILISTRNFSQTSDFKVQHLQDDIANTGGTNTNTFTIQNTVTTALNLTGSSPYVTISGTNATDFTLTANPTTPTAIGSTVTFDIPFNPSALGLRTETITIANDKSDKDPYNFDIQRTGVDLCGGYVSTYPYTEDFESGIGQWTQDASDSFDWTRQTGGTPSSSTGPSAADNGSYYIFTEASSNTNNTGNIESPCFDLTGTSNPRFTFFYHMFGSSMGSLNVDLSTDSGVTYPTSLWTNNSAVQGSSNSSWIPISIDLSAYIGQTIKFRIQGITGNGNRSDMAIDNISVIDKSNPTVGPGGITTDLALWLKANEGLSYTDGQSVSSWQDQGRGSDVRPHTSGQEPTYRDNANKNVNFNPVIEFDNTFSSFSLDSSYTYDDTSTEFLIGDFGYYTQEIFIVLIPDDTVVTNSFGFMDLICGDSHLDTNSTDTTGLGFGDFTGRVSNEVICYAHDIYNTQLSPPDGYAVAQTGSASYDNVGIINTRNNAANTQQELYYNANDIETTQNDIPEYMNSSDTRFWIARSEGWEATTNARIAEVISYSVRKTDTDLTQERNRIQSYLAVKYGITLGVNGASQDYVNSDGTVIWDVNTGIPAEDVFNYDIAGFGRDDVSDLYQKQSRSVNNALDGATRGQGVLTMGITSIYDTNNLNPNTLNDKEFLLWGNDGIDLDDPALVVDVDLSESITPTISGGTWVEFNGIARTWKVIENGGDIPSVEVAILTSAVRTAAPPNGIYLMFISDTPNFDPTAEYRVMSESTNELGEAILKTNYDFDNTKYITFGWTPERVFVRSIYFDGSSDYVDMEDALDLNPSDFTISSWIKREFGSKNKSILSKRDLAYTEGYDFKIDNTGRFEVSWINGTTQTITSNAIIPEDEWHHLSIIYSGGTANLYIDGVLDESASLSAPVATSQSFNIAAAGKGILEAFFKGNIDEVRVWDSALTLDQLHYIMNQEIEDNSAFVGPSYFISRGITPTKDEVNTLPWADLAGYYPMSTYTYTNTKDESGNGNQGALRNLRTVDRQTAPLPYESTQDGDWDNNNTWLNGDVQSIPGATSVVDNKITVDWNIVKTSHNVTLDNLALPTSNDDNRTVLALFVDSNELTVTGDHDTNKGFGLTVSHYLNLDGKIDLEGESQLIQTLDSDLEVASSGTLEKDQQGTKDLFTYNYWSSPVGISNITTNNNSYTLPDILLDGTNPASPIAINFLTSGYDGTSGSPIGIADYWIWKYANNPSDDYSQWQHVRSTGIIEAGEGYTMKGVEDSPSAFQMEQNYVFEGKPNNGDISKTINVGNDYLIGNPYPSALDANEFIYDNIGIIDGGRNTNGNIINGALYFWDHFASLTHILAEYEGGYATYTLMGGAAAISNDIRINANGGVGTKYPKRYIPVSQGFFVSSILDAGLAGLSQPIVGGSIVFKNSQRIYKKEATTISIFLKSNSETNSETTEVEIDSRPKIRLTYDSPDGYHRQLLAGVDENATNDFDLGYDAPLIESNKEDMYWQFNNTKFIIQAVNNFNDEQVLPFGIKTNKDGLSTIKIEELENIETITNIFVHDNELNVYHDLKQSNYEIFLVAGEYLDRFEIVFKNGALGNSDDELISLDVHFSNAKESIIIINPTFKKIQSVQFINMLGQIIYNIKDIPSTNYSEFKTKNISSGTYTIKLNTETGTLTKKVLVK